MSDAVIKVENVGKQYHLGKVGTGTMANDLNRWWQLAQGKEDPYLKIGSANDRTIKNSLNDIVWAIKDINFEVYGMTKDAADQGLMKKLREKNIPSDIKSGMIFHKPQGEGILSKWIQFIV